MAGIVEDELAGPTVFQDRAKLDFDWVPDRLLHRDNELAQLTSLFRGVAEGTSSQSAIITGGVGTGKTALSKYFCRALQESTRKKSLLLDWVAVNCRKNASDGLTLLSVLQHFDKNYPARGYSTLEMIRDLRIHIERRGVHLIVILDEADALLRKGTDLVYALTRFDDEKATKKPSLSLLLVSMRDDLPSLLDPASRSTLKRSNVLRLEKYNAEQLQGILAERARLAFRRGAVEEDVLELIAEIAAAEGDARYAIELLEGAGRAADEERSDTVDAEHVRAIKAHTRSFLTESKLRLLSPHQLYVLKGVARKLKRSRRPYLTTGEAEETYRLVAEEHGDEGRAHTQFWKYLKELETAGYLLLRRTEASATGQTQHISLHDIPASVLLEKLDGLLSKQTSQ